MNIYTIYCRMLVLAVMTLLMAVNLSQPAFADLERPRTGDCIDTDKATEAAEIDEKYKWSHGREVGWEKKVIKFQNTCEESWTVKYFHTDKLTANAPPYNRYPKEFPRPEYLGPYERALKQGESFVVSYVSEYWHDADSMGIPSPRGWRGISYRACPSTDDTLSAVDSLDALDDFQCAWR